MSSFASYCLNCGEAIRRIEYDEIAFCSLACQTRALLIVAEAQQQEVSGCYTIDSAAEFQLPSTQEQGKSMIVPHSDRPVAVDFGQTPNPVRPKLARPPPHTRHSVAVVSNLIDSPSSTSTCIPLQHPIMASPRSDIFSLSSVANPVLPNRQPSMSSRAPPQPPSRGFSCAMASPRGSTTSPLPPVGSSPPLFLSPSTPRNKNLESQSAAEALYRQYYPKFASRRHLRDQSPNNFSPRMSDSLSASTASNFQLLTPPSVI
ncbi:hypothetical protein P389DRAFT_26333 [Cystobasidium minutum MCA 4210]|uniref:uncharacterized protein n=1 Tax=Cystobasidium minutum MCA 4210 TaxID=1397322 RepID=UPI0034CD6805|eukprot:jgi/Rhomi1/26333/CE26332_208